MDFNKEKLQSELFRDDAGQYKDSPYFSSSKYRLRTSINTLVDIL